MTAEIYNSRYTVPWFGRAGLFTRDPVLLVYLKEDCRFAPYGVDRLQPHRQMIEWMAMHSLGISLDDVSLFCESQNLVMHVLVRLRRSIAIPGRATQVFTPGDELAFSYREGLIAVTANARAVAHGTDDPATGDSAGGGDCRP